MALRYIYVAWVLYNSIHFYYKYQISVLHNDVVWTKWCVTKWKWEMLIPMKYIHHCSLDSTLTL